MASYSLHNLNNYKQHTSDTSSEIFSKFLNITGNYLVQCNDNIHMRNIDYYKYVVHKGISTIGHVFLTLYLYTNNLELTAFHSQKAAFYYVEFIGQIGDDHHSFLQLNSKDAVLFVYKKTIFEIDNTYRKEFVHSKIKGSVQSNLESLINIYVRLNEISLQNTDIEPDNKILLISKHKSKIDSLSKSLINLSNIDEENFNNKLDLVEIFINTISSYSQVIENLIDYVDVFAKKLKRKTINTDQLKKHMSMTSSSNKLLLNIEPVSINKFINTLFV